MNWTTANLWIGRIQRLVQQLEAITKPSVVILDSRNGLHDVAAALIAGLEANVLMFAVDSEPTWNGYRILFQHWATQRVIRQIRERLYMVAALVPPPPAGPESIPGAFPAQCLEPVRRISLRRVLLGRREIGSRTPRPMRWPRMPRSLSTGNRERAGLGRPALAG